MAETDGDRDAIDQLLPWWSKLVHRIVVDQAVRREDDDEETTRPWRFAPRPAGSGVDRLA
jgi:hypothetical protein